MKPEIESREDDFETGPEAGRASGIPAIGTAPAPALRAAPLAEDPLEGNPGLLTTNDLTDLEAYEKRLARAAARKDRVSAILVSLVVHGVNILILGLVIISEPRPAPPQIIAVAERASVEDPEIKVEKIRPSVTPNANPSSKVIPVLAAVNFSSIAVPTVDQPPPDLLMPGLSLDEGLGMAISFSGVGDGWDASLPAAVQSRCSLVERMSRLKVGGGSKRCETAVERALTWLSETQNPDGSWGRSFPVAMTGLSLLSFLGRCETPDSPVFAETVVNAATYLMEVALKNDGTMQSQGGKIEYEHAICAYALCELFTLSRRGKRQVPELKNIIEKAIPIIIAGQNPNGSWNYRYAQGRSDTSVTGWQIQALKAAMNTEIDIPNLEASFEKSMGYLLSIQQKKGGFGYSEERPEDRPSLSGVGVLGLQFGGRGDSPEVERGLDYILDSHQSMSYSNINFYGWYYATQACFQEGDKVWRQWNDRFLQPLLESQEADGHWPPERSDQTDKQSDGDGDVYRNCLATLMLEVYYRYLPTGERIK